MCYLNPPPPLPLQCTENLVGDFIEPPTGVPDEEDVDGNAEEEWGSMVVLDAESSEGGPEADTVDASPATPSTPQPLSVTRPQAAVDQEQETPKEAETREEAEEEEEDEKEAEDAPEVVTESNRPASSRLSTGMQVRCGPWCTLQHFLSSPFTNREPGQ